MALAVVWFPGTLNTADPGLALPSPSSQLTLHLLTPLLSPMLARGSCLHVTGEGTEAQRGRRTCLTPRLVCGCPLMLPGQTQSSSVPASRLTGGGTEAPGEEVTWPTGPCCSAAEPGPEPMCPAPSVFTQATVPLV